MIESRDQDYVVIINYTDHIVHIKNQIDLWCDTNRFKHNEVWYFKTQWYNTIILHVPTMELALEAELRFS